MTRVIHSKGAILLYWDTVMCMPKIGLHCYTGEIILLWLSLLLINRTHSDQLLWGYEWAVLAHLECPWTNEDVLGAWVVPMDYAPLYDNCCELCELRELLLFALICNSNLEWLFWHWNKRIFKKLLLPWTYNSARVCRELLLSNVMNRFWKNTISTVE